MLIALLITFALRADDFESRVRAAVAHQAADVDDAALKKIGPRALPILVRLYNSADEAQRDAIAIAFYRLGWKSSEAKAALMKDVHTPNQSLRMHVQYALGRVSSDVDVVDTLAAIMQNDDNALFRDKAACALAYDQIHLTEQQKVQLYRRVIHALRDPKEQVRQISIQVLQIQTGQTKGFVASAPLTVREKSVRAWEAWIAEYASHWP
jgi:HEAT repeat protein